MAADRPTMTTNRAGAGATLLGFACASGWALLMAVGYFADFENSASRIPALMAFAAAALGPIVLMLFSALAAREGARANSKLDRVSALTEMAMFAPSPDLIEDTRELAMALRTEVEALDAVVHIAAKRLDAFETGLRKDGGLLARALAEDIAVIERTRQDLNAGTIAVGDAIARHVATLREGAAEAAATLDEQVGTFGAVSARIGARSAEFAAAATQSSAVAGQLDAAVDKALAALAHASSLTDTARKSAEEAASVAQEAAGAVRGATRTAVAEARDAAKRIRADAAQPHLGRFLSGIAAPENVAPPQSADVITMKRLAREAPRPVLPDLATIVAASGVSIPDALSAEALDHIAQAARRGPDARRDAVRFAAPRALRQISAHLRRDAGARRDCEALRREPGRALGAPTDAAARRRDLASAYLLIDAVLG